MNSSTWNLNPANSDLNNAANWTPATVPNVETDVATFAVSNTNNLQVADGAGGSDGTVTAVAEIIFQPGASSYTFTMPGHVGVAHIRADRPRRRYGSAAPTRPWRATRTQ